MMDDSKRRSVTSSTSSNDDAERPSCEKAKAQPVIYTTWPEIIRHWPKKTFCIIGNEFCERFSFYGMRTVLTLYLLNVLKFSNRTATVFFNGFTVVCYLTPLLGSILADGFIGKFWTILVVSVVYASGQIILAISSIKNFQSSVHPWLDLLGLVVVAFGTGGIKPCVSSFGADQIEKHQARMLTIYFSMFYFSINAGSMISTFVSPLFRSRSCLGQDSCYPLAFGIPAILMVSAIVIFALGSFWYKRVPVKENIFASFARTIAVAVKNKIKGKSKKEHWLDYYLDSHTCAYDEKCLALKKERKDSTACQKQQFVDDVKSLLRVLVMYLPVPMFWALYDQQGSTWTIQALQMNCRLWGNVLLLPDQMQTLNAVLILVFIPLFQVVVYPLLSKCFSLTPLRRMVIGGVIAALAFVISALVQFKVNTTLPELPADGQSFVSVTNTLSNCNVTVTMDGYPKISATVPSRYSLIDDASIDKKELLRVNKGPVTFRFAYTEGCSNNLRLPKSVTYNLEGAAVHNIVINEFGTYLSKADTTKPTDGNGEFSLTIHLAMYQNYTENLALCRLPENMADYNVEHPCDPKSSSDFYYWQTDYNSHTNDIASTVKYDSEGASEPHFVTIYVAKPVKPGKYVLYYMYNFTAKDVDKKTPDRSELWVNSSGVSLEIEGQGGVYMLIVTGEMYSANSDIFQVVPDNKFSILWQVPQYITITTAEIFFSVTGYEFAYSQAAPSMKSIVQALWLLTTAIGDTIIVLIALWDPFSNKAIMFLAYAAVMFVVIFIFALMSIFYYEYNYYIGENAEDDDEFELEKTDIGEEDDSERTKL